MARTSTGDSSRSRTLLAVMPAPVPPTVRVTHAPSARRRSPSTVPDDAAELRRHSGATRLVACGHGRPRAPGVGRRQPLLRGARRLHPPPRPRARSPHRAVGHDRRAAVPRARRQGEPGGHQRHLRPDLQARLPQRLLPRQPEPGEPARAHPRPRAHPSGVPRSGRSVARARRPGDGRAASSSRRSG